MSHALAPMRPRITEPTALPPLPLVPARAPQAVRIDGTVECAFCGSDVPANRLTSSGAGPCCLLDHDDDGSE